MPEKIKRGLGLVVVAVIALLIGLAAKTDEPNIVSGAAGLTAVVCGGVGLVLIAASLLRD